MTEDLTPMDPARPFNDDHGVTYEPFVNGFNVGYRITHANGDVDYLILNPSGHDSNGISNVFIYHDEKPDDFENPLTYVAVSDPG